MIRILSFLALVEFPFCNGVAWAEEAYFGSMKANKVLFLGNSMCLATGNGRGLAATSADNDYVHLLAGSITTRTGASLRLELQKSSDYLVAGDANVVNVADIFERGYATYSGSGLLDWQLGWHPDIVVLQIGENVTSDDFDATMFKSGLRTLLTDLKECNDPNIFITSGIMSEKLDIDSIKEELVAEDPSHRMFVDLSGFRDDPTNRASGEYVEGTEYYDRFKNSSAGVLAHPGNKGMQYIADGIYSAMEARSAPEPSSLVLAVIAAATGMLVVGIARRRRQCIGADLT